MRCQRRHPRAALRPGTTVFSSMRRSFRYHAGTAAFGSLIIAIIKTIRAIVAYIQKKAKKTKTCKVLVQVVLCVIQCCLWCVEKCMKFINKNAYSTGQHKRAKFPTSKAPISASFHSFRLTFGRAIISRNGLDAWMLFS